MTKPILFNTEMVRAILDGRKTQTRRIIKPQPSNPRWNNVGWLGWDDGHGYQIVEPCRPGDILWVRETWKDDDGCYLYKADDEQPDGWHTTSWRPSIHMPKGAARIFLKVKEVKPCRLRDMESADGLAEGIKPDYEGTTIRVIDKFVDLWNSTIKPADLDVYGWNANPWVWVIEFERCERPEGWPL